MKLFLSSHKDNPPPQGEVVNKNLGRYVPPRFSKTGSMELMNWSLRNEFLLIKGAKKLSQNRQKLVLKCKIFFSKMVVGPLELEKGLKRWVSRTKRWFENGGLEAAHPRTTF